MDSKAWIRENAPLLLVGLALAVLSPVISDIWPERSVSLYVKILLTVGDAALVLVTVRVEIGRQRAQRRYTEQVSLLKARGSLLQHVSEETRELLSEVRQALRRAQEENSPRAYEEARRNCLKDGLQALCTVLQSDSSPPDSDPLKAVYFKATIFEASDDESELVRAYWYYPDTIQPRTASWSVLHNPHAGAVQAFVNRQEIVMSRVADAAAQGRTWEDGWDGQREAYNRSSMICVPIWRDPRIPGTTGNTVRAVMTLDTNQVGYFGDGEDLRAFRAQVFAPFLGIIRLVYSLTEGFMKPDANPDAFEQSGGTTGDSVPSGT